MEEDEGAPPEERRIQSGDVVGYRFVIRDAAGEVLAASTELLHYVHGGSGSLPDAIEAQMEGRQSGEIFTAALPEERSPEPRVLRRATLPNERLSGLFELTPGSLIDARGPDGADITLAVERREGITLSLDFDHPFSKNASLFEVSVLSIRTATSGEWQSGRPDGPTVINELLKKDLLALRDVLTRRFADEESSGGLFDVLLETGVDNERRIGVLRDEHQAILEELDQLVSIVRAEGTTYDHRPALARLTRGLTRHDDGEADLLIDSMNRDIGGEG
jgi:FKBP-type peptidyl-prolyl cis-trans isomerase 2